MTAVVDATPPAPRRCSDCADPLTVTSRRVCARCCELRAADRAAERDAATALVARPCRCARPAVLATGTPDPTCSKCGRSPRGHP